ncbi:MAG TPA: multidrug efflux RND transporter permease subunit [Polyangiaceae bacterium]|nr:multidrug efflux RND transporter permease subunit [Polyangiaceae bacterium]
MFVDFFIKRPVFALVCAILIVLAGGICIPTLPIAQYPDVALPQVVVSSFYTGANAEVVESTVTTPLEQAINGVQGMRYISSVSSNDGTSTITITFDPSRNIDLAAVDVQNLVATAQARLPNEVKQTGVTVTKSTSGFVMAFSLSAKNDRYDQEFISNYADIYLRDALKRVPGVGDVHVFGERKFAMRLWLNPDKLAERGLNAGDVVNALAEQNLQVPAGQIGQPPSPAGQDFQISLQVAGRLVEAAEFENIVLKAGADGTLVRVGDIGRAELGAEDYSASARFNGRPAVGMGILQLPNANALNVRDDVLKKVAELSQSFPPGLEIKSAFDTTAAVSASVKEVEHTLLIAVVLVIGVIFLFLQSGKSTLIPAITIPVSLIGTFAFVKLFGFSINTLTLFGLTLATGLVVDDAIVVIENVQRFIDEKKLSARDAAAPAMHEVTGAVVATSLVLIAVFAPVAFFPGTTGRIYQQFSLTIAFSVALSLFNSLTLTPALSARLLKPMSERKNVVFRGFERGLSATRDAYMKLLARVLRLRALTVLAFAAFAVLGVWLYTRVPGAFLPDEDQGYFIVNVQAPSGSSLGYTERVIRATEGTLQKVPEIQNVFAIGGFSFLGSGPNRALMFITLKSWDERDRSLSTIIEDLRGRLLANPDALILPFTPPAIRGVGSFGGFQFELEDLTGGSVQKLAEQTRAVSARASASPELRGVFSSFSSDYPELLLSPNRQRAKQLGVPLTDVFQTLQVYLGSQYVNDFTFGNRSYRVYVQAEPKFRDNPRNITQFYVRSGVSRAGATNTGGNAAGMVSLDNLLTVEPRVSASEISHFNLFRSAEINGSAAPGTGSGDALAAMERAARSVLPRGMGFEWSGIALEQLQAGRTTLYIFAFALTLVFLVLAAQYESFSLPIIVLFSVPLGLVGALLAQLLRGLQNDVFCQIGLVMLIGLSSKNAILIVEFAHQLRDAGQGIVEAALEAARVRLRPILMTSFAFILGVLPLVVASGSGAESRHSLGTTVFGGMLFSTLMNLFFVPALYAMIESAREKISSRRAGSAIADSEP